MRTFHAVLALAIVATAPVQARAGVPPEEQLARIRASPALADDPTAIDELARDLDALPSPVRVEARMIVADAWLDRMHRSEAARALLRQVADDPEADPLTSRLAERKIVEALAGEGRLADALAEATSHASRLDPSVTARVKTLVRRRWFRAEAVAALGAFGVLAAVALGRAALAGTASLAMRAMRRTSGIAVAFAVYLALGGGVLASQYDAGNGAPFALLSVAVLPLVLLARAWSAVGSTRVLARAGRAAICALGVLAAAFLLLDVAGPTYLEGFGL